MPESIEKNTDFEVRSLDTICINESETTQPWYHLLKYTLIGLLFGILFVKAEIISWFAYKKCFVYNPFICMVLSALPLLPVPFLYGL